MDDATGRLGRKRKTTGGSVATPEREPVDPSLPDETDARAREIRHEIAQTRDQMSETIDAIQDHLKPSTIVANATETVKNATTEKVKQMANTAEYAADRVIHNTFMDTVRDNPWPVAMIGIGAAWLWMKGRSDGGEYRNGRYAYGDDYTARDSYGDQSDWRRRTAPTRSVYASGQYSEGTEFTEDIAGGIASQASEYVEEARTRARRTTRRARNSFNRVLSENPLALGAAATIVGVAVGMTLPETDIENEWMGEARDTVVERAREVASDAAERVGTAADQVKNVANRAANVTKP
jgi:Protein of unknown function (DUF3618)